MDTNLSGSQLAGAHLAQASLGSTLLINVDLEPFCAEEIFHFSPSTVDFASVARSVNCQNLKQFLRDTGMPQIVVDDMVGGARALTPSERLSLTSYTYVSYAGPDERFARRLQSSLREDGISTFFFAFDAKLGEMNANAMQRRIREHDRVVIVCSSASLGRPDIRNELNAVRERENAFGQGPRVISVLVDDYLCTEEFKSVDPVIAEYLRGCVVADFRDTDVNPSKYRDVVIALEEALKHNSLSWPPPRQVSPSPPQSRVNVRG
jgi:hypothetical protein